MREEYMKSIQSALCEVGGSIFKITGNAKGLLELYKGLELLPQK